MICKNKAYKKELDIVNSDLKELETNLIKGLNTVGIEFLDLEPYMSRLEALTMRKNKILYLIALES